MEFVAPGAGPGLGRPALPEWGAFPELRLDGGAERVLVDDHRTSSSRTLTGADGTVGSRTDSSSQTTRLLLLPGWAGAPPLHHCLDVGTAACLVTITWPRPPEPTVPAPGRQVEASVAGAPATARAVPPPTGWDHALALDASLPRHVPGRPAEQVGVGLTVALRGIAVPERPVVDIVAVGAYLRGRDRMIRGFEE